MKPEDLTDEALVDSFSRLANHNQMVRHTQPYAGNNAGLYVIVRTELLRRLLLRKEAQRLLQEIGQEMKKLGIGTGTL